jgi:hypothetical protein
MGEYWDTHDTSELLEKGKDVKFEFDIKSEVTYYPIEQRLSETIGALARKQGLSSDTLVNLWVQQKLHEYTAQTKKKKVA